MKKLDFIIVFIIGIAVLFLFILLSPSFVQLLVRVGVIENSKIGFQNIIVLFYTILGIIFVLLATIFIRVLAKFFGNKDVN